MIFDEPHEAIVLVIHRVLKIQLPYWTRHSRGTSINTTSLFLIYLAREVRYAAWCLHPKSLDVYLKHVHIVDLRLIHRDMFF